MNGWKEIVSSINNENSVELVVGMKSTPIIMIELRVEIISRKDHNP